MVNDFKLKWWSKPIMNEGIIIIEKDKEQKEMKKGY